MIEYDELSLILERYGIDPKTVINNNANVLIKGEYKDIETTIKYLVEELNISPKNIEKAPSIMYLNVSAIKRNVKYLKKQNITFSNIETCLHILSTKPEKLEETFNYIKDNYGIEYINRTTTILGVNIERIKEIEKLNLDKKIVISAACSNLKVNEISKAIKVCKENNIEITGTVFLKSAEEIEKIIKVCRENNITITGSIFLKTSEKLIESIDFIKDNYALSYLTSLIVIKDVKYLKEVFPYLEEMGVLEVVKKSASILSLSLEEIKERKEFIESINEPLVLDNGRFNSIFGMSRKRYLKKVNDILSSNRQM